MRGFKTKLCTVSRLIFVWKELDNQMGKYIYI